MGEDKAKKKGESYILDKDLVKKAIEIVMPAIRTCMEGKIFKRKCLSICVLEPKKGKVLHTENIKDEEWDHDFEKIASSKAKVSYKGKTDTALISLRKPWSFEVGDTIYPGGVYYKGLVIGVSGVEPYFDEMIANWIIFAIKGLCSKEMGKNIGLMNDFKEDFLPEDWSKI